MNRLVLLVLKLLKRNVSIEDVLELFVELAKLTPVDVDDKIANKLLELYKKDPDLFMKVVTLIISIILSDQPFQEVATNKEVKQVAKKSEEPKKKEEKVEVKEDPKDEDNEEESDEKIKQEVDDLIKGLFQ